MPQLVPVAPFDCVVFGGTGDLSFRKLLPALYHRDRDGQISADSRIICVSRAPLDRDAFVKLVDARVKAKLGSDDIDAASWARFVDRLHYVALDVNSNAGWSDLGALLGDRVRVFYLAMAPALFGATAAHLRAKGLTTPETRVVLEKPIGTDLASARAINDAVGAAFEEHQIFRIDHYLGKETVQNLLALRFANALFEPIWNANWIDHVQITVAETVGLEGRGDYYDHAGALRDMVQNHLMQLLCLTAMEPPREFEADAVRDEKLKVLRALMPFDMEGARTATVRGQYHAGAIDGVAVPGYAQELGRANGQAKSSSLTETFVAIRAEIQNWRWAGVPFYLRTGKRMERKASEIVLHFRPVPYNIFPESAGRLTPNRLIVRLQPDEGIRLELMTKEPGPGGLHLRSAPLDLSFAETFQVRYPDAYERLLMDVVRGNPTLFMRRDEVEAAWMWTEPLLAAWESAGEAPKSYVAGSWGPAAATALIERDGRTWNEEVG